MVDLLPSGVLAADAAADDEVKQTKGSFKAAPVCARPETARRVGRRVGAVIGVEKAEHALLDPREGNEVILRDGPEGQCL